MAEGSISLGFFRFLVEHFVNISNQIDDKWQLATGPAGDLYLCKKDTAAVKTETCTPNASTNDQYDELLAEMETENMEDVCCMPGKVQNSSLTYEYHIVYSESYSVPVLYFIIYKSDGKLLPLEDIWRLCPSHFEVYLKENKWATLTQQEHPFLGRPFFQLHPCHTVDLMTQIMKTSTVRNKQDYLISWLSTVGPLVGLNIPSEYILSLNKS